MEKTHFSLGNLVAVELHYFEKCNTSFIMQNFPRQIVDYENMILTFDASMKYLYHKM